MTAAALSALVFAWLCHSVPPDRVRTVRPEAAETIDARRERYHAIADDIAAAVLADPEADQRKAAALLVAIAVHESALAKDVDAPDCHVALIRRGGCDGGRARSLWQLQGVRPADRREAAALALKAARRSLGACRALSVDARLAVYAAGVCTSSAGQAQSREMYRAQQRLLVRRDDASN